MRESRMANKYDRLAEKTELSYEEALALKEETRKRGENGELAADTSSIQPGGMSLPGWTHSKP
jgi:hypothetical protein